MNKNLNPEDAKLGGLLRESRRVPALPPRFRENVWRRIEDTEAPAVSASWLDTLAVLLLRPRLACAIAAVLLFTGVLLGAHEGSQLARHEAQTRYVASVAPDSSR